MTPEGVGRGVEVRVADLKALFFPRPGGESGIESPVAYGPAPDPARDGKRLVVRFMDGETMTGHALSYRAEKAGFFLYPDDPESQHEKIYILQTAVSQVLVGPTAQAHPIVSRTLGMTIKKKAA
ncbi:MAG: hypothetical protein FD129_1711 [bacterium]|nr:MAG: hypothetical protein FD129_1711 [bacterium]